MRTLRTLPDSSPVGGGTVRSALRTGTVNGLPCVSLRYIDTGDIFLDGEPFRSDLATGISQVLFPATTPWTAGLPENWERLCVCTCSNCNGTGQDPEQKTLGPGDGQFGWRKEPAMCLTCRGDGEVWG